MMKRIFITYIVLLSYLSSFGQTKDFFEEDGFFDQDTSELAGDTLVKGNTFFKIFKGKPGKAAMWSLVIPGGGQLYNRSWWKVPLAVGIDFTTVFFLVSNTRNYNTLNDAYLNLLNNDVPFKGVTDPQVLKNARDRFRKAREYSYIYLIVGHLITVFDAFVDNHLQDFDVSDDLSLEMRGGDGYGTRLSLVISLNKSRQNQWSLP